MSAPSGGYARAGTAARLCQPGTNHGRSPGTPGRRRRGSDRV